jgi:serine/threonine protein phosphatase PrpC
MQKQVADLHRLIRLQNRVILGLSSLFAVVVMTTIALINTAGGRILPHPNDDRRPFWEQRTTTTATAAAATKHAGSRFGPGRGGHQSDQQQGVQAARSSNAVVAAAAFDDHGRPIPGRQQLQPMTITAKQQQQREEHPQLRNAKKRVITTLDVSKCKFMYFGCPLPPVELSKLNVSDAKTTYYYPSLASSSHLMLTHKSNRLTPSPVNQDRAVFMPSYVYSVYSRSKGDILEAINDPGDDFFVGIFDGHGDNGHLVSQFLSEEIPSRIAKYMIANNYDNDKGKSIDEDLIVGVFREVDEAVTIRDGGSTATAMVRIGNQLYMANTGDSTAFVCTYQPPDYYDKQLTNLNKAYFTKKRDGRADADGSESQRLYLQGKIEIHHQNTRHKPHLPLEKSRIEERGGTVHVPSLHPEFSRVIVHETSGAHGGENVGLAMSRSIGDREWTAVGVIPDPDVVAVDLGEFWSVNDVNGAVGGAEKRVFVVLGSDGLFDARKAEYVASHVAYGLFEWGQGWGQNKEDRDKLELQQVFSNHLLEVGKKIVDMASPLKKGAYRDDITFIAKRIELQE